MPWSFVKRQHRGGCLHRLCAVWNRQIRPFLPPHRTFSDSMTGSTESNGCKEEPVRVCWKNICPVITGSGHMKYKSCILRKTVIKKLAKQQAALYNRSSVLQPATSESEVKSSSLSVCQAMVRWTPAF